MQAYDPMKRSWHTVLPGLWDGERHVAAVRDGVMHVLAGFYGCLAFNPATPKWETVDLMPSMVHRFEGRMAGCSVVNPVTKSWEAKAPTAHVANRFEGSIAVASNGHFLLAGGDSPAGSTHQVGLQGHGNDSFVWHSH